MTQIPSKPSSDKNSNGRSPYFENIQLEEETSTINNSPTGEVQSFQEQQVFKLPKPPLVVEPDFKTPKNPLQRHPTRWWRFASLRTKAIAVALALGTVPIVAVGTIAYFAASQGLKQQIIQNEQINATDLQDKLNLFVQEAYTNTILMSNLNFLTVAKVRDIFTREDKDEILNRYIQTFGSINSIVVYDPKAKKVIAASDAEFDLDNILTTEYTEGVMKTDRPFIADPRPSKATGTYSLFIAAPVKDKATGQTIAIIRVRISMTEVEKVFGTQERPQEYYLLESTGEIAAASEQKLIQKKLDTEFPQFVPGIKQRGEQLVTQIFNQKIDNREKIFTYVANKKLTELYNLKWGLIVSRPTAVAFAPQRDLLLTLLIGTGATAVLLAAIAVFLANRATRPILDAAKAVDKIGQGELDTRVEVQGEDELAVLGANINEMASQLQTFTQEQVSVADEQRRLKEELQQRALELLMEVDPISKGDLTIRAKVTADEIGTIADSYNATVANLRKIVTKVQQAASQVTETTSSNEASVQSLSAEALRQAEEIAAALTKAQEMAQSVRLVAANAEQAEAAVKQANQTVQEGDAAMNRTVDGIMAIRETVAETAKKVKHLGESSQKISTVVNLISSFAAQTNLLALNASIEAARAGEEGRGFAVVADEVRSLARQSAEATGEIEKLVAAIQAETNEVVVAMEAGTEQVVTGTKLVDETRQSLNKITAASAQINTLVEAIAQATVVQSQASESVTQTMTSVAASAEKTSQEATFVSSSFGQLLTVAQTLQDDVGQFKVS